MTHKQWAIVTVGALPALAQGVELFALAFVVLLTLCQVGLLSPRGHR